MNKYLEKLAYAVYSFTQHGLRPVKGGPEFEKKIKRRSTIAGGILGGAIGGAAGVGLAEGMHKAKHALGTIGATTAVGAAAIGGTARYLKHRNIKKWNKTVDEFDKATEKKANFYLEKIIKCIS